MGAGGPRAGGRARATPGRRRPAARSHRRAESGEPYSLYTIETRLHPGTISYQFSRAHPENRFEILNRMEVPPDLLLLEVRVTGPDPGRLAREGPGYPEVVRIDAFPVSEEECLHRVLQRMHPVHRATAAHSILVRYPVVIRNGTIRLETVERASRVRSLVRSLKRVSGPSHVVSVRPVFPGEDRLGLTRAEETVFREALSTGYFGVPRGISVTGLARRLGRSKSTVSVALAKIQRKLASSAMPLDLRPVPQLS